MSYSLLIHEDTVNVEGQVLALRTFIRHCPRGTIVVRTANGERTMMRYPLVSANGDKVFLAYKGDIVYGPDIEFIEAYDPHPEFDPEGV